MTASIQAFVRAYIETNGNLNAAMRAGQQALATADTTACGAHNRGDRLVLRIFQPGISITIHMGESQQELLHDEEHQSQWLDPQVVYYDLGGFEPRASRPPNR
jgi:hypothetical protein